MDFLVAVIMSCMNLLEKDKFSGVTQVVQQSSEGGVFLNFSTKWNFNLGLPKRRLSQKFRRTFRFRKYRL